MLISRIICMIEKSWNFHTVVPLPITEIYSHTYLTKISWKQHFSAKITLTLISWNIFSVSEFLTFPHCVYLKVGLLEVHLDLIVGKVCEDCWQEKFLKPKSCPQHWFVDHQDLEWNVTLLGWKQSKLRTHFLLEFLVNLKIEKKYCINIALILY